MCEALELILSSSMVNRMLQAMNIHLDGMACKGWETRPSANFCGTL